MDQSLRTDDTPTNVFCMFVIARTTFARVTIIARYRGKSGARGCSTTGFAHPALAHPVPDAAAQHR